MNLWAKRAGLLLSAAVLIFLMSCEDDSYLLGYPGNSRFKGIFHEIIFDEERSSVILLDSVFTDQYSLSIDPVSSAAHRYMIGQYMDPDFGIVSAGFSTQFFPNDDPRFPVYFNPDDKSLVLDSTTVQLMLDFYAYGPEVDLNEQVDAYQLRHGIDSLSTKKRYINTTPLGYDPDPVGHLVIKRYSNTYSGKSKIRPFNLTYSRFDEQADRSPSNRDTIMLQGRLNPLYGSSIFNYLKAAGDTILIIDSLIAKFGRDWPGLSFVSTQTGRVIGLNPLHSFSRLTFHYHVSGDTVALRTPFYFTPYPWVGSNGFTNITTIRSGGLSGMGTEPNQRYFPSGNERYIQDGSGVITELDLSDYYSFIDTLDNIVINSAEISIDVVAPPPGMPPPSSLFALLMKKNTDNGIVALDMDVEADSLKWRELSTNIYTEFISFAVSAELTNQSPMVLSYNSNTNKYSGYATLFFQKLFDNKDKPELNIEHIGFYPATGPLLRVFTVGGTTFPVLKSGTGNSVNRTIIKPSGIKLKIYYTKPNLPNLE